MLDVDHVQTFEQVQEELQAVEDDLARRFKIRGRSVRRELLSLDQQGKLVEDEVVAQWHGLYAVFADWLEWKRLRRVALGD